MKKLYAIFTAALLLCIFTACTTTKKETKATLSKQPERMFWKITGTDANGLPSTVYIQGTFHLADDRAYPLADQVLDAWDSADRLVGEVSLADYASLPTEIQTLVIKSYLNAKGQNILDKLSDEQIETLNSYLSEEMAEQMAIFEPWCMTTTLSGMLYTESGLSPELGLDNLFIEQAVEEERDIEGLDELQTQLDVLCYGDYDTQLAMLQEMLDELNDPTEINEFTNALYEAYLADDVTEITKLFETEEKMEKAAQPFYEDYYKTVYADRNEDWARDITSYLQQGGTTFIFAGAAHWLGDKSVFSYLRKMGTIR